MSLITIVQENVADHERWAFRSYSVTFAAVTLRLYLPLSGLLLGPENLIYYYPVIAWLCWVPNVIVIAIFLRDRDKVRVGS